MFGNDNLEEAKGLDYIVGARIKRWGSRTRSSTWIPPLAGEVLSAEWEHRGRRPVVELGPGPQGRARPPERQTYQEARTQRQPERATHGNKRFIAVEARLVEEKIREAGADCKHPAALFARYRDLWQESFHQTRCSSDLPLGAKTRTGTPRDFLLRLRPPPPGGAPETADFARPQRPVPGAQTQTDRAACSVETNLEHGKNLRRE